MPSLDELRIGLVQINNSHAGENYFPYTVGTLQAYARDHVESPERFEFLLPIYSRIPVEQAVRQLEPADVACFSSYVWNIRISLEIARRLKDARPDGVVLFGGPQVPDHAEDFLRKHPFIDLVCHGEGERMFASFLDGLPTRDWRSLPSVSFLDENGAYVRTERSARIRDLSVVPSPYLSGVFDALMEANPQERWLALWETNRGCPFSCTFCDWGSAVAGKVNQFPMQRLLQDIDWFSSRRIVFLYCCDANFGILPRDVEIARYLADVKIRTGYPPAIAIQGTKNATERIYQIHTILNEAGLSKGATLAMQSLDPDTLRHIKRENISAKTYRDLQQKFTADGIHTYSDLIIALPGETYDSCADGVSAIIQNGQHNRIRFACLAILPNAEMGDPEYQKQYGLELVETKIITIHTTLDETEEIAETQQLVVSTSTMPRADWVRTRVFCWMTGLLHFDKLLQIPLVLLNHLCGTSYREMIEAFLDADAEAHPVLASIRCHFTEKALEIQEGGFEYSPSKEWLNIWWVPDEWVFIKLCVDGDLEGFYAEARNLLERFLSERGLTLPAHLLEEALDLNHHSIKLPFQSEDLILELQHNLPELYRSCLKSQPVPLEAGRRTYRIDRTTRRWGSWEEWYQEVIWHEYRIGSYLYGCAPALPTAEVN